MKDNTLESEYFSSNNKHYFIDYKVAANKSNYIKITRSDLQPDKSYLRNSIIVWEESFEFLIEAFSMLFTSVIHRKELGKRHYEFEHLNAKEMRLKGIKSWEPEQRPREKLMRFGIDALSNAELLAILIGSGSRKETAVGLAERILEGVNHDLTKLAGMNASVLKEYYGMGLAKSLSIVSAMELARRQSAALLSPFSLKVHR